MSICLRRFYTALHWVLSVSRVDSFQRRHILSTFLRVRSLKAITKWSGIVISSHRNVNLFQKLGDDPSQPHSTWIKSIVYTLQDNIKFHYIQSCSGALTLRKGQFSNLYLPILRKVTFLPQKHKLWDTKIGRSLLLSQTFRMYPAQTHECDTDTAHSSLWLLVCQIWRYQHQATALANRDCSAICWHNCKRDGAVTCRSGPDEIAHSVKCITWPTELHA